MPKLEPRKTIDNCLKLPDDMQAELMDGELSMTPAPSGKVPADPSR